MLAAEPPSTLDALTTLWSSVLEWNNRLDELNGKIALRQIELARLEENRPPTRSLRNKGSTESLRPQDGPAANDEDCAIESSAEGVQIHPSSPPKGPKRYPNPGLRPSSATPVKTAAPTATFATPPPQPFALTPKKSPPLTGRPPSHTSSPAPARPGPTKLQKRKPDSLMSGESAAPKYRTRSMIIVYYDSAVQSAFEELVKFVSGSRNAMRKGKMAAKMAEMRRAAEMEVEADGESEGDDEGIPQLSSALLRARGPAMAMAMQRDSGSGPNLDLDLSGIHMPESLMRGSMPRYTSARQSARPGGLPTDGLRSTLNANVIKRPADGEQDIFEKIDKSLEWCQSHCEFAAHKFLREGDCSTEIDNIKNKLSEVRTCAGQEVEKLKAEEAAGTAKKQAQPHAPDTGKSRDRRPVQLRKTPFEQLKELKASSAGLDPMEADDEGFEEPSEIVFQRSRDITPRTTSGYRPAQGPNRMGK